MRFPQYHIATSVINRILNLADDVEPVAVADPSQPALPDTAAQSVALDAAIAQPVQAVPAPEGSEEAILLAAQDGGSAADAVGGMAVLESLA